MFLVVFSLCMGALAAWVANGWVNERLTAAAEVDDGAKPVIVAAMDIPYGTKIEGRHMKVAHLPEDSVPETAFSVLEEPEGMVATTDISRGEVLVAARLARHDGGSTLAALVQENMRAVTVRVDDVVGVAGFLLPGNRVDVLATRMERGGSRRARTETILKNIKVLAVDQTAATQQNEPVIVRAVTLELTPNQSEEIVKAKEEGTIQLTLRNPLDEEADKPQVVMKAPALPVRKSSTAVVRRSPTTTNSTVTVIRGTHVNELKTKS
jgi:pilus assembly protein CpaB